MFQPYQPVYIPPSLNRLAWPFPPSPSPLQRVFAPRSTYHYTLSVSLYPESGWYNISFNELSGLSERPPLHRSIIDGASSPQRQARFMDHKTLLRLLQSQPGTPRGLDSLGTPAYVRHPDLISCIHSQAQAQPSSSDSLQHVGNSHPIMPEKPDEDINHKP